MKIIGLYRTVLTKGIKSESGLYVTFSPHILNGLSDEQLASLLEAAKKVTTVTLTLEFGTFTASHGICEMNVVRSGEMKVVSFNRFKRQENCQT